MSPLPEYQACSTRWREGDRSRELALHTMFLAWMHWADPPFVTGLDMADEYEAQALWHDTFQYFGGLASDDAEFLFVAGHMAKLFPWALGREADWIATARKLEEKAANLEPEAYAPERFTGRGSYGEYFAHISKTRAGAA